MSDLKTYVVGDSTFKAVDCIEGILIDPVLPKKFDDTANDKRPNSHYKFWYLPFIATESAEKIDEYYDARDDEFAEDAKANWVNRGRVQWMSSYPTGVRYCVRCLDGGAWDRSTNHGFFGDIGDAILKAKKLMGIV